MKFIKSSLRAKRSNPEKWPEKWIAASAFGLLAMTVFLVSSACAQEVSVETFCEMLPEYKQPAGVEYQSSVDVHGKPVAPADVPGSPVPAPFETIEIPVTVDLISRFGLNVPAGVELKPYVALISIHKDGRVDYNGQDVSRQARALCDKGNKDEQAGPAKPR